MEVFCMGVNNVEMLVYRFLKLDWMLIYMYNRSIVYLKAYEELSICWIFCYGYYKIDLKGWGWGLREEKGSGIFFFFFCNVYIIFILVFGKFVGLKI